MCGYCTEQIALDIIFDDVQGNLKMKNVSYSPARYFYMRETKDFISSLDRLRRSIAQKHLSFFSEVPSEVILYRGLEILLEQGFTSPTYQQLLKKQLYRDAIVATCSDEKRKNFELATEGLDIKHLGLLYDAETYFWGERSKQLRTLAHVLPSCRNLLKHYISWWLKGQELQKNDLDAMMEETGIFDPINDISDEEHLRFNILSRAFYFCILTVGSCSAGKKMLLAIAQRPSAGVPWFDGDELWLNRIAALKLYDLEGFDAFLKHLRTIRATNFYYICIVRDVPVEKLRLMLDEVRRHPEADTTDNYISLSKFLSRELGEQT